MKKIVYTAVNEETSENIKTEFYSDKTFSSWYADGRPAVVDSLWDIREGQLWYKHTTDWECVELDSPWFSWAAKIMDGIAAHALEEAIWDET